jgi:hypothetical protein
MEVAHDEKSGSPTVIFDDKNSVAESDEDRRGAIHDCDKDGNLYPWKCWMLRAALRERERQNNKVAGGFHPVGRTAAPVPPIGPVNPEAFQRTAVPGYSSSSCLRMSRHSESLISACRGTGAALRVRGFAYGS